MLLDPPALPSAARRPLWEGASGLIIPTRVRVLGSAIGLLAGAAVAMAALAVEVVGDSFPLSPVLAVPVVWTGAICGWWMAPAAWSSRTGEKVGVVIRMALLAVVVGDATLVFAIAGGPGGGAGLLGIMLIGVIVFGWIALPFAAAAAAIWVAAMALVRRRILEEPLPVR